MENKILIFGSGQVGNFYKNHFQARKVEARIAKVDITDETAVSLAIKEFGPTTVINTAAKTNLEWCSKNKLETFNINVLGADNIARACARDGIYFIHFSSGCIFESKSAEDAKKEDDTPNPAAYYAWTKVWSENLISFNKPVDFKYLILRPRQPVSSQINHKNMLLKLLTFINFIDTPNAGTVLEDLMDWTDEFLKAKPTGVLHVANEGWTTPYKIGLLLKKYVLPDLEVNKISKEDLDKITPNKRVDTILDINKLKNMGIEVKPYEQRLEEIIKKLGERFSQEEKETIKKEMELTAEQSGQRTTVNEVWKKLLG